MSGERFPECNVVTDLDASKAVFECWPGNITASGFEVSIAVTYPHESVENDFGAAGSHPLNVAYTHWGAMPYDRPSWDLVSVYEAVTDGGGLFEYSPNGNISVDGEGLVTFEPSENGRHRYVILPDGKADLARAALVSVVTGQKLNL